MSGLESPFLKRACNSDHILKKVILSDSNVVIDDIEFKDSFLK